MSLSLLVSQEASDIDIAERERSTLAAALRRNLGGLLGRLSSL